MCMTYLFFPRKQSVKPKPTTYQSARGIKKKGHVMERVIVNYKMYLNDVLSRLNDVKNKRMNILSPSEIETLNEANTIIRSIRKELYGD